MKKVGAPLIAMLTFSLNVQAYGLDAGIELLADHKHVMTEQGPSPSPHAPETSHHDGHDHDHAEGQNHDHDRDHAGADGSHPSESADASNAESTEGTFHRHSPSEPYHEHRSIDCSAVSVAVIRTEPFYLMARLPPQIQQEVFYSEVVLPTKRSLFIFRPPRA